MVNVLKCENNVEPAFTLKSPKSNYGVVGVVLWVCSSNRVMFRCFTVITVRVSFINVVGIGLSHVECFQSCLLLDMLPHPTNKSIIINMIYILIHACG